MSLTPDSHSDKPVHGQFKENASVDAAGPLEANIDRDFERKTLCVASPSLPDSPFFLPLVEFDRADLDFFFAPTSRKVDRRLLIILGALYAVSLIDRTSELLLSPTRSTFRRVARTGHGPDRQAIELYNADPR